MPRLSANYQAVKRSMLDSPAINAVSEAAEAFYTRLLLSCDGSGRFLGSPFKAAARAATARLEADPQGFPARVAAYLDELEGAGLIRRYTVRGEAYLELARYYDAGNKRRDEFPAPPPASGDACPLPGDDGPPVGDDTALGDDHPLTGDDGPLLGGSSLRSIPLAAAATTTGTGTAAATGARVRAGGAGAPAAAAGVPPGGDPTPPDPGRDPSVTSTAAARSRPGHAEIAERLVAELLAPAGLEGAAAAEAAEHLAGPRWLGGHSEAQVRARLAERVQASRGARNPAGWLRQAIREGGVPSALAPAASEGRDPRLRPVDEVVDRETRARSRVRQHRDTADRLRRDASSAERRGEGSEAERMLSEAAQHEARADEIEQALEAAQAQAVAS